MEIEQQIAVGSSEIADLILNHQDLLETNDEIVENINTGRKSMEFFMALGEAPRALYEVKNIKQKILQHLGLV